MPNFCQSATRTSQHWAGAVLDSSIAISPNNSGQGQSIEENTTQLFAVCMASFTSQVVSWPTDPQHWSLQRTAGGASTRGTVAERVGESLRRRFPISFINRIDTLSLAGTGDAHLIPSRDDALCVHCFSSHVYGKLSVCSRCCACVHVHVHQFSVHHSTVHWIQWISTVDLDHFESISI